MAVLAKVQVGRQKLNQFFEASFEEKQSQYGY
jgi:hypothetical protein